MAVETSTITTIALISGKATSDKNVGAVKKYKVA